MQKIRPDMDIGKNIQAIRYKNNMTQDQVVAKLNLMGISITKSTYAKLETNRMNIKASDCKTLSYRYQCFLFRLAIVRHSPTPCVYNSILKIRTSLYSYRI